MAKKRGPDTFISRLFTRHEGLRRVEGRRASEMARVMKDVKKQALGLVERNMTTFREAGEYIDSAAAVARAEQTVAGIDALMAQRADWATSEVLSMRKEAWTQGVADIEFAAGRLPGAVQASMQGSFGQAFPEAAFSAVENPVLGVAPNAMFNGVRAGTTQNMRNVLVNAVVSGESVQETGRRLSDAMDISVAAGERIARTNVNAMYNEAHKSVYDANSDIIAGYAWEATLDDRTSQVCFMLHGEFWPTGSKTPGPPAHWNCRSILIPVFKDPAVQALLDDTPRRAKQYTKTGKSRPILIKGTTTPEQWARRQPADISLRVTGSKLKNSLFRRKLIGFDDLVDPSLRVRTDQEIIKRAAALHPGNKALQKQARAMGIKTIPSPASIRRADAGLARKQAWRKPRAKPSLEGRIAQPLKGRRPRRRRELTVKAALRPARVTDVFANASASLGNVPVGSEARTLAAVKARAGIVATESRRLRKKFPGFNDWLTSHNKALKGIELSGKRMVIMPNGQEVFAFYDPNARTMTMGLTKKLRTGNLTLGRRTWGVSKDAFDGTFRHEIGHAFFRDMATKSAQKRWFFDIYEKHWANFKWEDEVSRFAQTDPMEAFAEVFSAFTHPQYKSGMLPKDIVAFLSKMLRFGKGAR